MEPVTHGITLDGVARFVDLATDALSEAREEIDALNVYPVPDGDTGTNMFLTVSAARDGLREARAADPDLSLADGLAVLARSALLGARGNSGVILSQMLQAFVRHLAGVSAEDRRAEVVAAAMAAATDASYAAVGTPVEGTILTVSRAASDAALKAAREDGARGRHVFVAAAAAARAALVRTPEQLPVLAQAGVVDAGGRGLCVVLDAVETVSTGRRPPPVHATIGTRTIPVALTGGEDLSEDGPAYEVMYLLDADDDRVPDLRSALAPLGDSLVVVGGQGLWNVHVHVDDVGAAVEAGISVGRPHRIRVTHFAEQVAEARSRTSTRTGRKVVAVVAGDGLAALFESAGAVVVPGGPGRRPSTGQILEAVVSCGAAEVIVLPNDADTVRAAEIAARTAEHEHDVRVEVIPTRAQVQGLAAVAVHEPGRVFDADVREMTATARHARHGAVTVAARRAITMAGPCEPGDALGVIAGDFALVGSDLREVATGVVDRLLGGGGELVTIVSGAEGEELAADTASYVEEHHPYVDVVVHQGGQDRYPLLVSVE
ncbi:MAG: Dihydroxyacetone kinase-like protein, phosphatase domain / Dihydroxyacetone kinase-like protein, kinase domain [uncultured Nocardioides sp.]|uniref:Dihydroxyacetone kinase-like protein, phosphatase domain / Dihydroxyacetone kinase-like protein, kinase domain n=1 Tax=uncultured Nocardioides sp. TaxID=198441 RepID=A0A6J4NGQ4_9ACTN|nr:MAG: Dihydroxyacetone kinase-like protein, phosphatase domain / Dihydroxyacetone kinase-like protein, kinase domain [uncultured Nocardioides sp.]